MTSGQESNTRIPPWLLTLLFIMLAVTIVLVVLLLQMNEQLRTLQSIIQQVLDIDEEGLAVEQLRQEVLKLQLENSRQVSFWGYLSSYGTLVTGLVAVVGVFITIWQQMSENRRQNKAMHQQREKDRQQREFESKRLMDENFNLIVEHLGHSSQSIQVSAAVSILTYLKPEYKDYHDQVYMVLLANLKLKHPPQLNNLLVEGFQKAIELKTRTVYDQEQDEDFGLDLSNTHLYRINLISLDLRNVDIGYADMRLARLLGANLFRAKGIEVDLERAKLSRSNLEEARMQKAKCPQANFHDTRLISAHFEDSNLEGAQFFEAKMQSAHFENANLKGARFESANLNDAYFNGAHLDDAALRSIKKALNWQRAHFDEPVQARLASL